jgi:acyl carrier protein
MVGNLIMSDQKTIKVILKDIVIEFLQIPNDFNLTPETKISDIPDMDSLELLDLILAIEECFDDITIANAHQIMTYGDLENVVIKEVLKNEH